MRSASKMSHEKITLARKAVDIPSAEKSRYLKVIVVLQIGYWGSSIYTAGVRVWRVKPDNGHPEIYLHPRV